MTNHAGQRTSVDPEEVASFGAQAHSWWDENGPFKPLHKLSPLRLQYIRSQICAHFTRDPASLDALKALDILDIGCGGGLVSEPLARAGAIVTGIDAAEENIAIAREHAAETGFSPKQLSYQAVTAEALLKTEKKRYDVVLALEIVEHVADLPFFVETAAKLVKPGGIIVFSTLNRTPRSFALGIVAAEYLLRWVPRGTHQWKKFVRPSELAGHLRAAGFSATDITGMSYNPLEDRFALNPRDIAVNYFLTAAAPQNNKNSKDTKRAAKRKKTV
jgi:2-polyprenyl-6-hydroxyphenyl methylase/3-demethylubiquinone-9 3-methyltransferase